MIYIFTDGSKTPTHCGYGVYCKELNIKYNEILPQHYTHNMAELLAIKKALNIIAMCDPSEYTIVSDSMYAIKSLTVWCKKWELNGWMNSHKKAVKNKEIILICMKMLGNLSIKFIHVRAHTNKKGILYEGNDIADKLAKCVH